MIDTLGQGAPDVVDQEELDASLTLHEAKQWGYTPGETPGSAEEYVIHCQKIQEIDARWRARFVEARARGASAGEIALMNRDHAREKATEEERGHDHGSQKR